MKLMRAYIAVIDRMNYGVGRVIMFGIFAMMAVLLVFVSLLSIVLALSGVTASVRHALGGGRGRAFAYALAWLACLAAFYGIMYPLIQIVFS